MAVLVTGGAGYIGSHTVAELLEEGQDVVIIDNLEKGHRESIFGGTLLVGDLRDQEFLKQVFRTNDIDSVIHFASYIEVGESVKNPLKYYNNNLIGAMNLLTQMNNSGVKSIVFSSTAAVYGEPENIPILETDRLCPTNPYGASKLAIENILKWMDTAYEMKYAILRYFNASGAHKSGEIGEAHDPESHLIPLVLQAASGKRECIYIYGNDYDTQDGTCVRDYIHVSDLAQAHLLALGRLKKDRKSGIYNLGNGKGFSVREVIDIARKVTGVNIKEEVVDKRPGDPSILVASSEKIKNTFMWNPKMPDLYSIIETAWNWHKTHPNGYSN